MNISVITDNVFLYKELKKIILHNDYLEYNFTFYSSPNNIIDKSVSELTIKDSLPMLIKSSDLVFSLHCKQLFPKELVNQVRCINVHPGLNPYNRGWFPQAFSIINGLPIGVTIHEIDELLDHGDIIVQESIQQYEYDTSLSLYNRILSKEIELIKNHLVDIIMGIYVTNKPINEGNLNLKKDFTELCKLDLKNKDTFQNHINILRALTHGDYKNAYFLDDKGERIYVTVTLTKDEKK